MKKLLLSFLALIFVSNCVRADDPDVVFLVGIFNDLKKEIPAIDSSANEQERFDHEIQVQRLADKFRSVVFSNPNRKDYGSDLTIKVGDSPSVYVGQMKNSRELLKSYFESHKINYALTEKVAGVSFRKDYEEHRQFKSRSDYSSSLIKLYRSSSEKSGAPIPVAQVEVWSVSNVVDFYSRQIDGPSHQESFVRYVGDVTLFEKDDQVLSEALRAISPQR